MEYVFDKYEGAGNDFIIIDGRLKNFVSLNNSQIKKLCDRNFGIGSDGLIILNNHDDLDFEMIYYNSNGNLSSMCGNGARCIAAFAYQKKISSFNLKFQAFDGEHEAVIEKNNLVKLKMNDVFEINEYKDGILIDTGSPHYIKLVKNLSKINVKVMGSLIRYSNQFKKEGINVNFIQKVNSELFKIRTYERGIEKETLACGTGAVAASLAIYHKGITDGLTQITMKALGGELTTNFNKTSKGFNQIHLTGEARKVYSGIINI
jgi:diaminopimelate epimerase